MADDSGIDDAVKRFEKALAGLEIASTSGAQRVSAQKSLADEMNSLKEAKDEIAGQLAQSSAEVETLKSTHQTASTRIDKVMNNLKAVLAGS